MAQFYFKIQSGEIRKAIKEKCSDPIIALSKNPEVVKQIANKAIEIVTPYVPIKTGALRRSGHVVYHEKQIKATWGKYGDKGNLPPTAMYARYQHNLSPWTHRLLRGTPEFSELVEFAIPLVKKEVSK